MSRIKLNLRSLSVPEKIARAQQIVAALTGNAHFTSPQPTLAQLTAAINELEAAAAAVQAARQEAKARTTTQTIKEAALDQLLVSLVGHVESVAGGNPEIIQSASLEMRDPPNVTADVPTLPPNLTATNGDFPGQIDLSWDPVRGARSYTIGYSTDPPTDSSWTHSQIATRSSATVEHLTPGTRYWFRVAAVGTRGQSPWSNPVPKIAQ